MRSAIKVSFKRLTVTLIVKANFQAYSRLSGDLLTKYLEKKRKSFLFSLIHFFYSGCIIIFVESRLKCINRLFHEYINYKAKVPFVESLLLEKFL